MSLPFDPFSPDAQPTDLAPPSNSLPACVRTEPDRIVCVHDDPFRLRQLSSVVLLAVCCPLSAV